MNDIIRALRDDLASTIEEIVGKHWPVDLPNSPYVSEVGCYGCEWSGRFPGEINAHITEVLTIAIVTVTANKGASQ